MHLIRLYFRLELKKLWLNKAMLTALCAFFGLLLYGLYNGQQHISEIHQEQTQLQQEEAEKVKALMAKAATFAVSESTDVYNNPMTPYEVGGRSARRYLLKKPTAFATLSKGESDLFPNAYSISLRDEAFTILGEGGHLSNPVIMATGTFDFAFVMVWLLPLLVILYAYDFLSEEKETGTLSLLRAQPVSMMKILWAKTIVKFSIITVTVLAFSLAGMGIMGVALFSNANQLLLLLGAVMAYILFWFLLSLLINLFRQHSITNLSILFACWLLLVLVVPTTLSILADDQHTVPSRIQLVNDIRTATQEIDNDASRLLDAYYYDHPELAPEDNKMSMASYVYKNALKDKMIEEAARPTVVAYREQARQQQEYVFLRKFYSPALIMQSIFDEMAGHTLRDFLAFQSQADDARKQWRSYFASKIFRDEMMTRAEIEALPTFRYQPDSAGARTLLQSVAGLLGFVLIVGCFVGVMGFRT